MVGTALQQIASLNTRKISFVVKIWELLLAAKGMGRRSPKVYIKLLASIAKKGSSPSQKFVNLTTEENAFAQIQKKRTRLIDKIWPLVFRKKTFGKCSKRRQIFLLNFDFSSKRWNIDRFWKTHYSSVIPHQLKLNGAIRPNFTKKRCWRKTSEVFPNQIPQVLP